ncbi:helix-turn-helix domain-containing protein [Actinoallomurus iriomotensis]|uniref:Transcriptional regulator n=1 Tax=Actinoallomurus iriomotensis TaxID=478107 RepID=A0A9W6RST6_9ACTN|nr:helix-turn-helix transcriptional regulator [Actinoallomurus iriomotensis]GLY81073.1 transcriptional regulator [Actinoallomurus iriomotensis]
MTDGPTGSTVPRRQLGRHLRELRNRARLTVRTAADKLEWSETKLWRIETGQTSLRSLDVEAMCRVYGAPPDVTEALMALAKETKARGWWHAYGDVIRDSLDLYIGLEEAASQLSWYTSELVPGLLQTPDYARTLIRAHYPHASEEDIERLVQVRIARQSLLTRGTAGPTVKVAFNEAVLRRAVGGEEVMAGQLERLIAATNQPNVSLRVVPFETGFHDGLLSGPFVMMRFPTTGDGREIEPPTVYVDGFTGALYLDKPEEIERYDMAFNAIWTSARNEARSMSFLHEAAREFKT